MVTLAHFTATLDDATADRVPASRTIPMINDCESATAAAPQIARRSDRGDGKARSTRTARVRLSTVGSRSRPRRSERHQCNCTTTESAPASNTSSVSNDAVHPSVIPARSLTNVATSSGVAAPSTSKRTVTRVSAGPSSANSTVIRVASCERRRKSPAMKLPSRETQPGDRGSLPCGRGTPPSMRPRHSSVLH